LLKEKAELAFNRHSGYECVDRLVRIRLLQGVQQDGDGVHIVEGGVRGGTGSERISLLIGTHHPQGSQQSGDGVRVVEGGAPGMIALGEHIGLQVSARPAQGS